MDSATAQVIAVSILGVASLVWLASLLFLLKTWRHRAPSPAVMELGESTPPPDAEGTLEVQGEAHQLATKLARVLAKSDSMLGTVRITKVEESGVQFVGDAGGFFPDAECHVIFERISSSQSRASYRVWLRSRRTWLLWLAVLLQAMGALVICLLFLLMQRFVIFSQEPAIRWQVFQCFQAVHFLWPPFLLISVYRALHRRIGTALEPLLANLAYR